MTLLIFEGVRILALVEAHIDIVSLSSATDGTLLELLALLLLKDLHCLGLVPPPYSSTTKESAMGIRGIKERS